MTAPTIFAVGITNVHGAWAEGGCVNTDLNGQQDFGVSHFDGHVTFNSGGYNGAPYRGVIGNISTRIGYSCDPPSPTPPWYNPNLNFTLSWLMLAQPNGNGWAQTGYFRFNGGAITTFAEYDIDGTNANDHRIYPAVIQPGQTHRYEVDYESGCACIRMWADGSSLYTTNFNPITAWGGTTDWSVQTMGETKDSESDVPGLFGTSCFFSAMGTDTSTQGFVGWIGWNRDFNDVPGRYTLGAVNEFPVNTYGYNFQIYTN